MHWNYKKIQSSQQFDQAKAYTMTLHIFALYNDFNSVPKLQTLLPP